MSNLTIVPPLSPQSNDITESDVLNLDTEKLKETMARGVYSMLAALSTQAKYENERIQKDRTLLDLIEKDVMTPEFINGLSDPDKLKLYGMLNNKMSGSLTFLLELHKNLAVSDAAYKNLETDKSIKAKTSSSNTKKDTKALDQVKKLIMEKIKEKSK